LLSVALGRGSSKVAAEAVTPEYRSLDDVPTKAFTYNFLICSHAVCEALTVLVAAFIPLVYNYNVASSEPVNHRATLANFFISLCGETLVADSLFCVMAARQQRRAHTFLATWQLRPRGSIFAFVAVTLASFLPVWYALLLTQLPKLDEDHFAGYYSLPRLLMRVQSLDRSWVDTQQYDPYNTSESVINAMADLRQECGAPPGDISNEVFCREIAISNPTQELLSRCCDMGYC